MNLKHPQGRTHGFEPRATSYELISSRLPARGHGTIELAEIIVHPFRSDNAS